MEFIAPNNYHVIDDPLNAIAEIRQKSISDDLDDDPFYICDISDIIRKHRIWQEQMPRVFPFYAVTCNDSPIVIQTLAALGTGFSCASKAEITDVLSHGVPSDLIIYANPTKHVSHLNLAAEMNVSLMTVDCDFELLKISKHYPNARLVLRIRYDAESSQSSLKEKYGCHPETEAPKLIELSKSFGLNMIGISFHVGKGCIDALAHGKAMKAARKLFDFAKSVGYQFKLLDIGGGFPGDTNSNIEEIASTVNQNIDLHFSSPDITVIAEPERFYVESAYTLACQIHSKREVHRNDKFDCIMYYINDGVYGSMSNYLYQRIITSIKTSYPKTLKPAHEEVIKSVIFGPTCDAVDVVFENVSLPRLNIGDFIIFENMGAYSISLATSFNGFPSANVEYYIERKHLEDINVARKNDEYILLRDN